MKKYSDIEHDAIKKNVDRMIIASAIGSTAIVFIVSLLMLTTDGTF